MDYGQTAVLIAFVFGTRIRVEHRNIVLDGHPNRPQNKGVGASKLWVQWEDIGKFQAIGTKFCTATTLGPRNMSAKFEL